MKSTAAEEDPDEGNEEIDEDGAECAAERRLALVTRRACSISLQQTCTSSATVSRRPSDVRGSPSREEKILLKHADNTCKSKVSVDAKQIRR